MSVTLSLSVTDKNHITNTWPILQKDRINVGKQLFLQIFQQSPTIKDIFSFKDCWGDDLLKHPTFASHATNFVTAFDDIVRNIHDDALVKQVLLQLGRSHAKRRQFSDEYFGIFKTALMVTWGMYLKSKFTAEVKHAWGVLFDQVTMKLSEGYTLEVAKLRHINGDAVYSKNVTSG